MLALKKKGVRGVLEVFYDVFLRPGSTVYCMYGFPSPKTLAKHLVENMANNLVKHLAKNMG